MSQYLWTATNESLAAIVRGLDINPEDLVLAVCSSGDQAFAMIEKGARVIAVDDDAAQVEYARRRAGLIKKCKFHEFLKPVTYDPDETLSRKLDITQRNAYFRYNDRLERIAENIGKLTLVSDDIFTFGCDDGAVSKMYLSNALRADSNLPQLLSLLQEGGLVYISCMEFYDAKKLRWQLLRLNRYLTSLSRRYEISSWNWKPAVYRKLG